MVVRIALVLTLLLHPAMAASDQMTITDLTTALRIVGSALFGLALLWGAAKIMASGGDSKMMEEGKNVVKNAIIGYILIMLASIIPSIGLDLDPLIIIP